MKLAILIPAYNEEEGIGATLKSLPIKDMNAAGYEVDILVVDNNSTDRTAEVAKLNGARVVSETKQGKGAAIKRGFNSISDDTDFVVMLDGDDTYKSYEILRLLEPLKSNFCDVTIGSRLAGKIKPGSMSAFNRVGNWFFSFLVRAVYGVNVTDVLTGYFAWKREVIVQLRPHLKSNGFAIEMEMITKMARLNYEVYSFPISYEPRLGQSSLRPVHDGFRILKMFVKNLRWEPRKTQLAFVSDAVYPFNKGGKERRLYEITKRLVKEGRDVTIYTMQWWSGGKVTMIDGVKYQAIAKQRPLYKGSRRSVSEAVIFGLASFKLLFKSFDIVDVDHMPYFSLFSVKIVCLIKRKKMYATWHEVWSKEYWREYVGGLSGLIGYSIQKVSYSLPDLIITNSEHTTQLLLKTGHDRKKIATIPLGVDLDKIDLAKAKTEKYDVIYVGRLLPNKNVDLLIDSISIVKLNKPDVSCMIVGDGPEKDKLHKQVLENKLAANIKFTANIELDADLYGLMKSAKVFVLPSTREGFGLIALEANACGLPVITTNHVDNASRQLIVEGKNGYVVPPDPQVIARSIINSLNAKKLNTRSVLDDSLSSYTWEKVINNLEAVINI